MIERGEESRLAEQFAEIQPLAMRNLDGDPLVDPRVFRQIDRAEAAAAQGLDNAVLAESLASEDHGTAKYSWRLPLAN
jgi:hypothetical protein